MPPPPHGKAPPSWRKDCSSTEIIDALLRAGEVAGGRAKPDGAVAAARAAAAGMVTARAAPVPPRPPSWSDPLGTAGAAIHHVQADHPVDAAASPGQSPKCAAFLARYRPYVGLEEWEAMKQGLNKEVVPIKRQCVDDYFAVHEDRCGPDILALPDIRPWPAAHTWKCIRGEEELISASQVPSARGASSLGSLPLREDPAPALKPGQNNKVGAALAPASSAAAARAGVAATPPTLSTPSTRTPGCMVGGRSGLHFGSEPSGTVMASSCPLGEPKVDCTAHHRRHLNATDEAALERLEEDEQYIPHLRMRIVQPNIGHVGIPSFIKTHSGPRVQDQDRLRYPTVRHMQPAREANLSAKRRLNELLKMPRVKIDPAAAHPSRSFAVVPSQNLRVV